MNISLPEALKAFVDAQVAQRGFGTSSEFVRELIRKEQDRAQLRGLLFEGAGSRVTDTVSPKYFEKLRARVRRRSRAPRPSQ